MKSATSAPDSPPTFVDVSRETDGRVRTRFVSGLLSPRLLRTSTTGDVVRVALVATGATLLPGDHLELDIRVSGGVTLELVDVAGTVAYASAGPARGGRGVGQGGSATKTPVSQPPSPKDPFCGDTQSCWHTRVDVAAGSRLVWAAEPLIVTQAACVVRTFDADIADGAALLVRDVVGFGRHDEHSGSLRCETRISAGGRPVLVETFDLNPRTLELPGVLDGARAMETVTAVGFDPPIDGDTVINGDTVITRGAVMRLATDVGGAVARSLAPGTEPAHSTSAVWQAWRSYLSQAGLAPRQPATSR